MAYAILLCAVASLSTGAGGIIVALWPGMSCRTLAVFQGFAAGVMIGISFLNMIPNSYADLSQRMSHTAALMWLWILFISGWVVSVLMSHVAVPGKSCSNGKETIKSVCIITTIIIIMHNLPEGMLTPSRVTVTENLVQIWPLQWRFTIFPRELQWQVRLCALHHQN